MTIFLWNVVFSARSSAFGYSKAQLMGYVFLVLIVQAFVTAAPSNDNIGGEISNGDLSNYLVKPVNYISYWLTRDLASKLLNILFAVLEITVILFLFRPEISIPLVLQSLVVGVMVWFIGAGIFFFITKLAVFTAFWIPENTWGLMFTVMVFLEMLSGSMFPLDVLPHSLQSALQFTPFPYLVYYPIGILIGHIRGQAMLQVLLGSVVWLAISYFLSQKVWHAGLKINSANGK